MISTGLLAGCAGTTDEVAVTGAVTGFGGNNLSGGCASTGFEVGLLAADCAACILPSTCGWVLRGWITTGLL